MEWRLISLIIFVSLVGGTHLAYSHNNTVIIPLGGSKGDAGPDHVLTGKTFSNKTTKGVTGTRPYAPVADTGITGSVLTGDDGYYRIYVGESVANRFFMYDLGSGLYDKLTGLSWESNPPNSLATWENALNRCENKVTSFLSSTWSDWRLPTINELHSIIDRSNINPPLPTALNITLPSNGTYWSSTPYALYDIGGELVWLVHMTSGRSGTADWDTSAYSICVRGQWKGLVITFPSGEQGE